MVNWILPNLGTAAAGGSDSPADAHLIDVRDLVDRPGNDVAVVRDRIEGGVRALKSGRRVVVCCDHGISRSNAVAAGILASYRTQPLEEAVREVLERTEGAEIKVEVLQTIREAIAPSRKMESHARKEVVLFTGASGSIGRGLAARLADIASLACPDRREVDLVSGAVQLDLLAASSGATCIVHFANPRVVASNRSLGESLTMLKNVLEVCRLRKLRLVFPSSWEVFSGYRGTLLADVNLPRLPKTVHGEAKHLAELLIEHYSRQYALGVCILRSGPIYGSGMAKPKFLHDFIAKAQLGQDIYLHRYLNGDPGLDLVCVDDYARAVSTAIARRAEGVFHVGTGALATTREVAAYVIELVGSRSALRERLVNDTTASIAMDSARMRTQLGQRPEIAWRDGIRSLVRAAIQSNQAGKGTL